jgi:hypothetical protein
LTDFNTRRIRGKTYGKVFRKKQYFWPMVGFLWKHGRFRVSQPMRGKVCGPVFRPALCARDGNMGRRGSARPYLEKRNGFAFHSAMHFTVLRISRQNVPGESRSDALGIE